MQRFGQRMGEKVRSLDTFPPTNARPGHRNGIFRFEMGHLADRNGACRMERGHLLQPNGAGRMEMRRLADRNGAGGMERGHLAGEKAPGKLKTSGVASDSATGGRDAGGRLYRTGRFARKPWAAMARTLSGPTLGGDDYLSVEEIIRPTAGHRRDGRLHPSRSRTRAYGSSLK